MKSRYSIALLVTLGCFGVGLMACPVAAATPQVANVTAVQRLGTKFVDVTYDLMDTDGHAMMVALYLSPDGGGTVAVPCLTVSGDVGAGILSGTGRQIAWDAGADYPGHLGSTYVMKVVADDGRGFAGMAWVPAGSVRLGLTGVAEPINDFHVEAFWIDRFEVSNARYEAFIEAGGYANEAWWDPVGWAWKVANGITLPLNWNSNAYHGGGVTGNGQFPVNGVSWWEADAYCRWAGVRLPTEAEWEKAAKGGCEIHGDPGQCDASDTPTYPWGTEISGPQANYWLSGDLYDSNGYTTPVGYYNGSSHGGYQTANAASPYGLYDVVGNVKEWCSTKIAPYPYLPNDGRENPPATYDEPNRVLRGGSWGDHAGDEFLWCANRYSWFPNSRYYENGFRSARTGPASGGSSGSAPFHLDTLLAGACCEPGAICTLTLQAACLSPGMWQGGGTPCTPNPCPAIPVLLESWAASSLAEGLKIRWEVPLGATGSLYRAWRDPVAGPRDPAPTPDAVLVSSSWISASAEGIIEILDREAPRGATVRYFLETSTDGGEFIGPVAARWDPPAPAWSVGPTPFRDAVRLTPPGTGPARAEIFDPAGRLRRTLVRADGNAPLEWDGRDDAGRDVSAGVYLMKGTTAAGETSKRVILAR